MKFVDEDTSKQLGTVSVQAPTIAAYEAAATEVYENEVLATALGGIPLRDFGRESYYTQLKCHDPTGDDFYVTFTRRTVRLSSYSDDAIRDAIEIWADGITELD